MNIEFKDKVVLITAASQGIGYAIAKNFYSAGAKVAICSRDQKKIDIALNKISDNEKRLFGFTLDLSNLDECKKINQKVKDFFGSGIDILVLNSGGPPPMSIEETDLKNWENAINQNLLSQILIAKNSLSHMKEKNFGRVIFLTSTTSKEPAIGMVLSNVTRAALSSFSKTLSKEAGSFGITSNTVLTGGCNTERLKSLVRKQASTGNESVDEIMKKIEKEIPVGYISSPDEFSKTILFLASNLASYINGVALPLDGGLSKGVF